MGFSSHLAIWLRAMVMARMGYNGKRVVYGCAATRAKGRSMAKTLAFLHTSPVHIATFARLLAQTDPAIPVRHIVDPSLLDEARVSGTMTPQLAQRVADTVRAALQDDTAVVVRTCSTICGCTEQATQAPGAAVLRVDCAMAEAAVAVGQRMIFTLSSTLAPTLFVPRVAQRFELQWPL